MAKKRAIVSYEKLSSEQKNALYEAFPDGYGSSMTQIKTPKGETLDALLWETEEIIYLVKIDKPVTKITSLEDDEDEDDFDAIEDVAEKAGDIIDEDMDEDDEDDEDDDMDSDDDEDEDEDDE